MKRYFYILAIASVALSCQRQIIVHNGNDVAVHDKIVEVDLCDLSDTGERDFAVIDENGDTVQSQITYDDKLIFVSDVPAMGKAAYRIEKARPDIKTSSKPYTLPSLVVAPIANGQAVLSTDIEKRELLDSGPIRYTELIFYFPIPVDTMWAKQRRYLTADLISGEQTEKVWFEDLKGEHEIMAAVISNEKDANSTGEDSLSFSHGEKVFRFDEPLHNLGYVIFDRMYYGGFSTKDGPEPLEFTAGKAAEEKTLEIEICGNGR